MKHYLSLVGCGKIRTLQYLISRRTITSTGCWLWPEGKTSIYGYRTVKLDEKTIGVHKLMLMIYKPEHDESQLALHKCANKHCFNPDHLYWGNHRSNTFDAVADGTNYESRRTHCPKGHEYSERNTYVYKGSRYCKKCAQLRKSR